MRHFAMVTLLIALGAAPALAQNDDGLDAKLTSYPGLCDVLRSHGIQPTQVNWQLVNPACQGVKDEHNQVPYNRCLLAHALDNAAYDPDSRVCNNKARAAYPDILTSQAATVTIEHGGNETKFYQQPLSDSDLRAKRVAEFESCMSDKGWRDPQNSARGRVNPQ